MKKKIQKQLPQLGAAINGDCSAIDRAARELAPRELAPQNVNLFNTATPEIIAKNPNSLVVYSSPTINAIEREKEYLSPNGGITEISPNQSRYGDKGGGEGAVGWIIPTIFKKNVKKNPKLRPFNEILNDVGDIQYFPAWSKEWRNSVYHFNSNLIKNFPVYDINIVKIIRAHFDIFFHNKFLKYRHLLNRKRRLSFNKIFFARPEIKHTNSKAFVTLYTYNRQKVGLTKKFARVLVLIWRVFNILKSGSGYSTIKVSKVLKKKVKNPKYKIIKWEGPLYKKLNNIMRKYVWVKKRRWVTIMSRFGGYLKKIVDVFFRLNIITAIMKDKNLLQDFYAYISVLKKSKIKAEKQANKLIKFVFKKEFTFIRKFKFKLNLNKFKFQDKLLYRLSNVLSKIYNKQIEFNIVNLKNIVLNADLFTEISTLKVKKRNTNVSKIMHIMLNKAKLPEVNRIQEKGKLGTNVNYNLVENKYSTLNLRDILNNKLNLDKFLKKTYFNPNNTEIYSLNFLKNFFSSKHLDSKFNFFNKKIKFWLRHGSLRPESLLVPASQGPLRRSHKNQDKKILNLPGVAKKGYLAAKSFYREFKKSASINYAWYSTIFNPIKYKNLHGIRMEVKGRLTPRYRADRSVFKVRWKGGLKNIASSYKGLSVRKSRGHLNPNVSYSIFSSKRRVGAFAVKGWTGAKFISTLPNNTMN